MAAENAAPLPADAVFLKDAERLRFAMNAAGIGTWELDMATSTVIWDDRCRALFGLAKDNKLPYEQAIRYIHPDDAAGVNAAVQAALHGGNGGLYEATFRTLGADDGILRWLRSSGTAYFDPAGKATRFGGIIQDVTDTIAAQRQESESQQQLLALFEQSPVALATIRREGLTFTSANPFYGELVGRKPEEIVGKPLLEALPEIAGQGFDTLLNGVLDTGVPFVTDEVGVDLTRNGVRETLYVNLAYQPMKAADGTIPAILVVATDVTPQVRSRQAVQESEARFRSLIEEAPVATCLFVGQGQHVIEVANAPMLAFWGKDASAIGQPLLDAVPELAGQPFAGVLDEIYKTGKPYSGTDAPAQLLVDGVLGTCYFNFTYQPLFNEKGEVWAIIDMAIDVTEQVLARKKIEESEARFRRLVAEAPVAIGLFRSRDLIIEAPNAAFIEIIGRGPDIEGKPLAQVMPELESQPFLHILNGVFVSGETFRMSEAKVLILRDGVPEERYFNVTFSPIVENGAIAAVLDISVDVTEQVLSRLALEESEAKLRSIVETAPAGIGLFVGRDLVIENPNQTFIDIVGKGWGVLGKPLREAMPELITEGQPFLKILDDVYTTGVPFHSPGSLVKIVQNGVLTDRYYNITYTPVFNTEGEVYAILDIAIDVTDQIKAQQELEKSEAALQDAVELAELGTWKMDVATGAITYSERLQDWLGLKQAILREGVSPRVHPNDRERIRQAMNAALQKGGTGRFDEVYTIVHATTGQSRIIHASGQALFDAGGNVVSLSGTAQDVTMQQELQLTLEAQVQERTEELAASYEELQSTNEELGEANSKLQHSNDELAQYAYVASHDLQEPLRKIQVFSGMLGKKAELAEDSRELVAKISASSDRMTQLIRDLLVFSRLLNSEKMFSPTPLDAIVTTVFSDYELVASEKGATLTHDPLPVLEAVPLQLNQLFHNLIGNALKFTRPDVPPVVRITSEPVTGEALLSYLPAPLPFATYYRICVADNGIGFETKYADQIFEVFKRLHTRDTYPGSGIGLALCRRIVANHGGVLYTESQPDEGSTFCFILPDRQTDTASALPADFTWKNLA